MNNTHAAAAIALSDNWTPTSENINALPLSLRDYIHELETRCDPAGEVRERVCLKENVRALEARLARWKWFTEMRCSILENANINGPKWVVVDIDDLAIGEGASPEEAIENAQDRIEGNGAAGKAAAEEGHTRMRQ